MIEIKSSLLNSKDFELTKETLINASEIDNEEKFRVDTIEYINDTCETEDDMFFYDMLEFVRFENPKSDKVAYTTPDMMIYLNCPKSDVEKSMRVWEFIYDHECLHQLWDTFGVKNKIDELGLEYNHMLLNIASDCIINDYLRGIRGKKGPADGIYPEVIKEKFGIEYSRKTDTQLSLYIKLLEVKDKVENDKDMQKMANDGQGNEKGQQGQQGQQGKDLEDSKDSGDKDQQNQQDQGSNNSSDNSSDNQNNQNQQGQNKESGNSSDDKTNNQNNQNQQDQGSGSSNQENKNESAKDAADRAKKASEKAQKIADEARKNGDKDAKEKQNIADKVKKEADKSKDAAEKADKADNKKEKDKQTENAKEAANKAEEEANKLDKGENSDGKGDKNSENKSDKEQNNSWGSEHIEAKLDPKDLAELTNRAKKVIEKYKNKLSGDLGNFLEKCRSSFKGQKNGLVANAINGKVSGWNVDLEKVVKTYVKKKVVQKHRQYERTFKRPRRGRIVKFGEPIKPDRRIKEDKMIINNAFYIDRSGSMGSALENVFDAAYIICDALSGKYKKDKVVERLDFKMFAFDTSMDEIKYGNKCSLGGGTMPFHQILEFIKEHTNNFMINVIITDAQFEVNNAEIKKFIKEINGILIFVTNNKTPEIKKLSETYKQKLYYIEAPIDFKLS